MKNFGIKDIIPIEFTKEIAQLTAIEFINLLKTNFNMSYLVIGTDFALGRNREGNPKTLSTLSTNIGFQIKMVDTLEINSSKISSTAIRKLLASGSVQKIPQLLGRKFSLRGNVVSDSKRGHSLGFPTANLSIKDKLLIPKLGIYATETKIDSKIYPSCTSIGLRPTFYPKNNTPIIETHIINYNNNIYDKTIEVFFIDRIRDEKKFTSKEKLIEQMNNDVDKAYRILKSQ
jgi:riboflavin kinase/FMN adenylyltransferase